MSKDVFAFADSSWRPSLDFNCFGQSMTRDPISDHTARSENVPLIPIGKHDLLRTLPPNIGENISGVEPGLPERGTVSISRWLGTLRSGWVSPFLSFFRKLTVTR